MSIPAGTYAIDASHSEVGFTIRHAGIAKVRGVFNDVEGQIVVGDDVATSSATATISASSVDTGNDQRDNHLRSSDFFSIDLNPEWAFSSTGVTFSGDEGTLTGDLTINGITRPVTLDVEYNGAAKDAYGSDRIGFSAETELTRSDYGITWNAPLEAGGLLLSDKVKVLIEISAVKQG